MSRIRAKDTTPEMLFRRGLHAHGLRFRLHPRDLPGKPDVVLPRFRAVVFVHGCFWHAHEGCRNFKIPSTRSEFWQAKLLGNRVRDQKDVEKLRVEGWRVAIVWECALRSDAAATIAKLIDWLHSDQQISEFTAKPWSA